MKSYMEEAIREALEGINNGHGGPFGTVIIRDGEIIGRGHNRVLCDNDPTAHGEVTAIRDACKNIGSFDLSGSVLYTTCYPCPMCLSACMWANIDKIIYGCTQKDADAIGFRDDKFYQVIETREYLKDLKEEDRNLCLDLFEEYKKTNPQNY